MSLLARIAAGVGGWLVQQDKLQQEMSLEQWKADILTQRELALKMVDAQIDDRKSARDAAERLAEIDRTGAQNRLTAGVTAALTEAKDVRADERDLNKAITLKGIDFDNDKAMEAFKHNNKLSEDQAQAVLDLRKQVLLDHRTVDRVVFQSNGQAVVFTKDGSTYTRGGPGAFNPSGSSGSGDLSEYLQSGGASSGASISRTAPPAKSKIMSKPDFLGRYNAATPETAPRLFRNGQKIPLDEAYNLYAGQ